MSAKRSHLKYGRKGGRFDPVTLARRLDRFRDEMGVEPKNVAGVLFPNQDPDNATRSWYRRANSFLEPFKLGEIEVVVDYLLAEGLRTKKLPPEIRTLPGFPFIELTDAIKLERGK